MAAPFSISLHARWQDMDFNQHMSNTAFLGVSGDCRMRFLAERGFGPDEFRKRQIGPVIVEDRLVYKKELCLLEPFRVELALAAATPDARKLKLRNSFFREPDGALAAVVESVALWFDLAARKPVVPPADLAAAWLSLSRTDDFSPF